jgi:hypothetical protein
VVASWLPPPPPAGSASAAGSHRTRDAEGPEVNDLGALVTLDTAMVKGIAAALIVIVATTLIGHVRRPDRSLLGSGLSGLSVALLGVAAVLLGYPFGSRTSS